MFTVSVFFIFHLYSVDDGNDLSIEDTMYYRVRVSYKGLIAWVPFLKWVTACELDLTYFPIDQQSCAVVLLNWMYGSTQVNFTLLPNKFGTAVDTSTSLHSNDWDLIHTSYGYDTRFQNVPVVYFSFTLQRVSTYFIINIIIPIVCLSILSIMVFKMPPEAGEKMGLSVTVLMSYSVILMIMSDNVPRSSRLPIISKLFILSI